MEEERNDEFSMFMLAGKASQKEYAGFARPEDATFDYSLVQSVLPHYYVRLEELEQSCTRTGKTPLDRSAGRRSGVSSNAPS